MLSRPAEGAVRTAALSAPSLQNSSLSASTTPGSDSRGCENGALMDSFGIFLQGLLGVVAFSTLMPWYYVCEWMGDSRTWALCLWLFLDTSKQAIGMLFIHFANVYLSDLTEEDPCSLYLINFLLDASLGMLVIYGGVRAVSVLVEWQQWESLRFGEYGEPVQCGAWVGQCALYILIMMFEKVFIILILLIPQWKKVSGPLTVSLPVCACVCVSIILISADDEMDDSEAEDDLRRLTGLKPVKKKKHRLGLPV
ncbi:STIMA regulator, partial [Amia calva]|nr:STIMA regulator [Amia calva]